MRRPARFPAFASRCERSPALAPYDRRLLATGLLALSLAFPLTARAQPIQPEPLPDPRIAGFRFPESEATLTHWITRMSRGTTAAVVQDATEKIHRHAWGLWTALTMETRQIHAGQRLRVFETWLTPDELIAQEELRPFFGFAPLSHRRSPLRELAPLRRRFELVERDAPAPGSTSAVERVLGFVKFDPTAAAHIRQQELLNATALDVLLDGGAQQIPPFPATATALKPVFQVLRARDVADGRFHRLKTWSGPPPTAQPWPSARWPGTVWIDPLGGGKAAGEIDPIGLADGSTRTDGSTYPLSHFIHYRLSAADAAALNSAQPETAAAAGDIALLVAMHVTTREIARWTWQTFWWTHAPDDPPAPSSAAIARARPDELRGAARHYAMSLAYTMLAPDQPYLGGENAGAAVYAYNPWLEAKLGPADLPDSLPGHAPDGQPAANNVGVQTNCMSCHAMANHNPHQRATALRFAGARYVDLIDPRFVGTLQVDFLWSLPRHAKPAAEPAIFLPSLPDRTHLP